MASRLMRKNSLTITRDNGGGYWDDKGRWVAESPDTIEIKGNIQPFKTGDLQKILPEGKTAGDAKTVYTQTMIKTADQFSKELADKTVINGLAYYAMAVEDWTSSSLSPDHFKVIFVRDDQTANGEL